MRGFHFVLVLYLAVGFVGVVARATAQEPTAKPVSAHDADARREFEAGRDAYHHGAFPEALAHFERAFELSKRPGLLFNIARAADADGQVTRARIAYLAYLEAFPAADNADFVRARVAKMQEIEAARAPAKPAVTDPAPTGASAPPSAPANAPAPGTQAGSTEPLLVPPAPPPSKPTAAPATLATQVAPTLPTVAAATPTAAPSPVSAPVVARDTPRRDGDPSSSRRRRTLLWTALSMVVAGGIAGGAVALTRDRGQARAAGDQYVILKEMR